MAENFRVCEFGAGWGDGCVTFFDGEEAEELGGVDDGEQVVDFKGEIVGEVVDVVAPTLVEEQLKQSGDSAGPGVRQHLVVHLALVANGGRGLLVGRFSRHHIRPGEHLVDVVDELGEGLGFAVAGLGKLHAEVGADVSGIAAEHNDAIGEQNGFFNVVSDEEDRLGGHSLVGP